MAFPIRERRATDMGMKPITDYVWPVTYRFDMRAPWGRTQQELTVDIPLLRDRIATSRTLGLALWQTLIAPAISSDVELEQVWCATWRSSEVFLPQMAVFQFGLQPGRGTERDHAGQLVLMSGHADNAGMRRLFLPCVPRSWVSEGLLTSTGFEALIQHARAMYMGLSFLQPSVMSRWLIAYIDAVEKTGGNPYGVAFREVTHVRVCQHTDKAPTQPSGLWP